MEQTKPTYRPWESKYSPHNRAVQEAQRIASSDRRRTKHKERAALREATREAIRRDPVMVQAVESSKAIAASLAALMSAPRRTPIQPHPPSPP